jgi:hypothetical protein
MIVFTSETRYSSLLNGPLQEALQTESLNATSAARIRDRLELYHIDFPTSLLSFEALTRAYQAECMIWMHGISILTCMLTLSGHVN